MIFDDSFLLMLYAVPFLFALVFPGWKSLGGAIALVISGALLLIVQGSGDGVGYGLGLLILGIAVLGFVSGAIVRAISFRWAKPNTQPFLFGTLSLVAFVIPPVVLAGPAEMSKWLSRPSNATCQATNFQLSMGGKILNLPGAPVFSLSDASEEMPVSFHSRRRSKQFEKFCADYLKNPKPMEKMLIIQPFILGSSETKSWIDDHCGVGRSKVYRFICDLRNRSDEKGIIDSAVVFDPILSKVIHQQSVFAVDTVLNKRLAIMKQSSNFENRLIMECDSYRDTTKMCSVVGILDNGLGYRFRMYTAEAQSNRNAWAIRNMLNNLTNELAKPPSSTPQ